MSIESDSNRYLAAMHAMQTGVAYELARDPSSGTPKHLRVGVNTAMCDHAALVRILVAKGIVTDAEYATAIADEMEREKQRYEEKINEMYSNGNAKISLG